MKSRLATILARGGSKGLPGKNIRLFLGEPLIVHSIRQALRCGLFDAVAFSSDSEVYCEIASGAGATFVIKRPAEMANEAVTKLPGIRHALKQSEARIQGRFDTIADLAVTSPLRGDDDISGAVRSLETSGASIVLSACIAKENPYFNLVEKTGEKEFSLSKRVPGGVSSRQRAPAVYALNGAVYAWTREELLKPNDTVVRPGTSIFEMSRLRSIDIDDDSDFKVAEFLAKERNEEV